MNLQKIYQNIAKENGITAYEVREQIQEAINYAYRQNMDSPAASCRNQVPRAAEIPTPEEMIEYILKKVGEPK